jgi:hypothetical protein
MRHRANRDVVILAGSPGAGPAAESFTLPVLLRVSFGERNGSVSQPSLVVARLTPRPRIQQIEQATLQVFR